MFEYNEEWNGIYHESTLVARVNEEDTSAIEYAKKLVELANKAPVFVAVWMKLTEDILQEHEKDGYCRLVISYEKALEMRDWLKSM